MRMYDIIAKKRDGLVLSKEEINYFIQKYINGEIPDYQASALLMAIYFKKMTLQETVDLTNAMLNSGDSIDLSAIDGVKVDKHSTGGVGDKITLITAPLVAAVGVPVAKMSGRGLGHTGGTIDKLEAFKNFSVELPREKFIENVNKYKIAIASQTGNLVPADKKLYALRDVTATVENISLIASSIMSKKLASGADAIVLDVKVGSGAFMKNFDNALELAREMVHIGNAVGKNTIAIITDMDQPLGNMVGNALEVKEAIQTLKNEGPDDLTELSVYIGAYMVYLAGKAESIDEAIQIIRQKLSDGSGLEKLRQLIQIQGGQKEAVDDITLLPVAANVIAVNSVKSGYVFSIKADNIGKASLIVGAGRQTKEDKIDLSTGIVLNKKVGDYVQEGECLAYIHLNDLNKLQEAEDIVLNAYDFSESKVEKPKLIKAIVTKDSTNIF